MDQPTIAGSCPHCGRGPGLREARAAIAAALATLPIAQVVDGWRYLALTHYIAALLLVERGAACTRAARALPGVSHDRLTRLLGERSLPALLMACLRAVARPLGPAVWIIDDVIVPKPACKTLAWAKGLWCPAERRYVHAINIVVLFACWGSIRIPLGFRLWCPKEQSTKATYQTKLMLARDLVAEALADRLRCQYVVFDSWYTTRVLTSYLESQGLIWHGALASNHQVVVHDQLQEVGDLGRQLHDWMAHGIGHYVASARVYSPQLGHVRLTRVRVDQPERPYLYLVTNDPSCTPSQAWAAKRSRWPVEVLFRDEKQLVQLAGCQSPRVEAQKAHIALVLVAWVVLQRLRQAPSQTAGEVQEALRRTVWGHETQFSASVSERREVFERLKAA
jgi:hypothetical protein